MRLSMVILLGSLLILSACSSGDDDNTAPTAVAFSPTPMLLPTQPAAPSPTQAPAAPTTPQASDTTDPAATQPTTTINADNFATLDLAYDAFLERSEYMAWQENNQLLVASRDEATIIDPVARTTETAYTAAQGEAIVAVSGAGQIAVSPDNRALEIHDTSGAMVGAIQPESEFGSISFSSDGSRVAVSRLDEIAVDIWNVADGSRAREITGFQTAAPVYSAQFGPNDASIIWTSRATVQVTDLGSGQLRPPMEHELFVSGALAGETRNTLVTTWATFATLWNVETGQRIQDLDQGVSAFQPALVPNADLVMVATDEGVNLWDAATFQEVATLDAPARQIDVSDQGHYLATLDQDGYLQVFVPPGQ